MSGQRLNPYVGPRPLERGDTLYGRDHELGELLDLLVAERVVMLHSPSGAGKSSLIHAGLLPELDFSDEEEDGYEDEGGFQVVGPLRVNAEIPEAPELAGLELNRFVLSLLLSAEEARPEEKRRPLAELAASSLTDYLDRLHREEGGGLPQLLILDQFEDVLTKESTNLEAKKAFFAELGQALRARERFALIAIREDYLAALAPYTPQVPTGLQNTYRLDLLGQRGAVEAIRGPAEEEPFNATFTDEAVERLQSDLRQVTVMGPDGTPIQTTGPHVEPVQLQVVCHRLWQELPHWTKTIEASHLGDLGNVDQALGAYYDAVVERAAGGDHALERAVRDWVEARLITEGGMRGQVMRVSEGRQGIAHACLDTLVDAHLVRGESRRGATWYELAHDRLVAPVKADNEAWRQENLGALQLQAEMWQRRGQPEGLLLAPEALIEADQWAADQGGELAPVEQEYLEASRRRADKMNREAEREEAARQKAESRRLKVFLAVAVALMIIAGIAGGLAFIHSRRAEEAAKKADVAAAAAKEAELKASDRLERMLTLSAGNLTDNPLLGTLLLVEMIRDKTLATQVDREPPGGLSAAMQLSQKMVPKAWLRGHTAPLTGAEFNASGDQVITSSEDGTARIWHSDGKGNPVLLQGHMGPVRSATFSPAGDGALTLGADGTVRLWTLDGKQTGTLGGKDDKFSAARYSPGGKQLLTGDRSGKVRLWSPAGQPLRTLLSHGAAISGLRFKPDGGKALAITADNLIFVLNPAGDGAPVLLKGHTGPITSAAFSEIGVISASRNGMALYWPEGGGPPRELKDEGQVATRAGVLDVGFKVPYTASSDGKIRVYKPGDSGAALKVSRIPRGEWLEKTAPERALEAQVTANTQLLVTYSDHMARLWTLGLPGPPRLLGGHQGALVSARVHAGKELAVIASADGTASVWSVGKNPKVINDYGPLGGATLSAAFSADSQWVATGSADNIAAIHRRDGGDEKHPPNKKFSGHRGDVFRIVFAPGSDLVASASPETTAYLWDLEGKERAQLSGHQDRVTFIDFSPAGDRVVTASADKMVRLWSQEGELQKALPGHTGVVLTARFSPDGQRLVSASADKTARIWNVASDDTSSVELKGHAGAVFSARFSPDGERLLTASEDKTARIWGVTGGDKPVILRGHSQALTAARFSPDGEQVLTASTDRTARLWSLDGKQQQVFIDHPAAVANARFSPDGKKLVTVSGNNVYLRQRDAKGEWKVTTFKGHTSKVDDARFSPDGKRLLTSGFDGQVRGWALDVTWQQLMTAMNQHTTICLSPMERVTYLAEDLVAAALPRFKKCEASYGRTGVVQQVKKGSAQQVRVTLSVRPEGARLQLDGREASPGVILLEPGSSHTVEGSAQGHATLRKTFTAAQDLTITLALKKAAARPAAPAAPRPNMEPARPAPAATANVKPKAPAKTKPSAPAAKPAPKAKKPAKAVYFEDEL